MTNSSIPPGENRRARASAANPARAGKMKTVSWRLRKKRHRQSRQVAPAEVVNVVQKKAMGEAERRNIEGELRGGWSWIRNFARSWRRIMELTEEDSCLDLEAGTDAIPPHIIANLVNTSAMASAEEVAELYQGLLRFVAVMIAQITSALQEGANIARRQREADEGALLQTFVGAGEWLEPGEAVIMMQENVELIDPFGHVLCTVQRQLERMTTVQIRARLAWIRDKLDQFGQTGPPSGLSLWQERMMRLRALVVSYQNEQGNEASSSSSSCMPLAEDDWAAHTWHMMRPFLMSPGIGGEETRAVVEVEDSYEGIQVQEADGLVRPATGQEIRELQERDRDLARVAREEAAADEDRWERMEAARYQAWEDWCVQWEMDRGGRPPKRMRVGVEIKGHGGKVYAGVVAEARVPAEERLSYIVEPMEVADPVEEAPEDAPQDGPAEQTGHKAPEEAASCRRGLTRKSPWLPKRRSWMMRGKMSRFPPVQQASPPPTRSTTSCGGRAGSPTT